MNYIDMYKVRLNAQKGKTIAQQKRDNSEMVVLHTWYNDPEVVHMYLYKHKEGTYGADYELIGEEDAKYIHKEVQEFGSQSTAYYVQFKPRVSYPIGTYMRIPDENGDLQWWIIVNKSKDLQFNYYDILQCNFTVKWIYNNKIYQCLSVVRSVNSYSSGIKSKASLMYLTDNRCKMIMPTDEVSQCLSYDIRVVISSDRSVPFVWKTTKIEELTPTGISQFTLSQDKYDEHTDKAPDGTIVADINTQVIHKDEEEPVKTIDDKQFTAEFTYSRLIEDKNNLIKVTDKDGNVKYEHPYIAQHFDDNVIHLKDRLKFVPRFIDVSGNTIKMEDYSAYGITPFWKIEGLEVYKQDPNGDIVYDAKGSPVVEDYNYTDYAVNEDYELTFRVKKNYYIGGTRVFVKLYSSEADREADKYMSKVEFEVEV